MKKSFSSYIQDGQILFKNAMGAGALRGREFHDYHEILLFIDGKVEFFSEHTHLSLQPLQIIIIPKESYHQFIISEKEDEYRRCVINFYDLPELGTLINKCMRRVAIIDAAERPRLLFEKIIKSSEDDTLGESEKKLILRSALTLLLSELASEQLSDESDGTGDSVASLCVKYVNAHLREPLSVAALAKHLNVSVSTLTHSFKKEMNISPYRYILKKKLVLAQHLIANGSTATAAALECGFYDYSGFYKQYKKTFGVPPSRSDGGFSQTDTKVISD